MLGVEWLQCGKSRGLAKGEQWPRVARRRPWIIQFIQTGQNASLHHGFNLAACGGSRHHLHLDSNRLPSTPLGEPMVTHMPAVSILMIINGVLNCLLGLVLGIALPLLYSKGTFEEDGLPPPHDELVIFSVIIAICGLLVMALGILNIVGGFCCKRFRARGLTLAALFANLGMFLVAGFFSVPGVALSVYGLIVLFNRDVIRTYERVARGGSLDPYSFDSHDGGRDDDDIDDWDRRRRSFDRGRYDS
jgi:hypothetical protein